MAKETAVEPGFYNGRFLTAGEVYETGNGEDVDTRAASPVIPSDSAEAAPRTNISQVDVEAAARAVAPLVANDAPKLKPKAQDKK